MESKLQADPLRHSNKSLFLRNHPLNHPLNFKQMSFIRSHAPTVGGVISPRLVDVYKQGRNSILETQKPLKKLLTSLHSLNDHSIEFDSARVIDKGISVLEKTWHTANTNYADNNAKQLPTQYSILFWTYISILTRTQAFLLFLL